MSDRRVTLETREVGPPQEVIVASRAERGTAATVLEQRRTRTGALVIEADRVGADTMLSRIVHMVAEAQRSRAINRATD